MYKASKLKKKSYSHEYRAKLPKADTNNDLAFIVIAAVKRMPEEKIR